MANPFGMSGFCSFHFLRSRAVPLARVGHSPLERPNEPARGSLRAAVQCFSQQQYPDSFNRLLGVPKRDDRRPG